MKEPTRKKDCRNFIFGESQGDDKIKHRLKFKKISKYFNFFLAVGSIEL